MKTKFFSATIVVVIAVVAMINVNLNKVSNNKGALSFKNVEALAAESNDDKYSEKVWRIYVREDGTGYNCCSGGSEKCI